MEIKVAIIQKPPAFLDREKTITNSVKDIEEAVKKGASLIVLPESYIPGYPTWIWRLKPGSDMALYNSIHDRFRKNAVDLEKNHMKPIQDAAAKHSITVACGMTEIDSKYSGTTLYNTVVTIGPDGKILNKHRKLMPTNPERMVWGFGDASGLRVVDTPIGRIATLICWENYMPLARYALYAQNVDIYVAPTWDDSDTWIASMRHIAKEAGCWVLSTATAMQGNDIPDDFPEKKHLFKDDEWINGGGAVVVQPGGQVLAGPLQKEKTILYADVNVEMAAKARRSLDVCGHYSRPDIFSFSVDRRHLNPVDFEDN